MADSVEVEFLRLPKLYNGPHKMPRAQEPEPDWDGEVVEWAVPVIRGYVRLLGDGLWPDMIMSVNADGENSSMTDSNKSSVFDGDLVSEVSCSHHDTTSESTEHEGSEDNEDEEDEESEHEDGEDNESEEDEQLAESEHKDSEDGVEEEYGEQEESEHEDGEIIVDEEGIDDAYFTLEGLEESVDYICKRTTWEVLKRLLGNVGLPTTFAKRTYLYHHSLQICGRSGVLHNFEPRRRCFCCGKGICKACENCLIKKCDIIPTPLEMESSQYSRSDSLAALRIAPVCIAHDPPHGPDLIWPHKCRCTEFLMGPPHDCEAGDFHFCDVCMENMLQRLSDSNTNLLPLLSPGLHPPDYKTEQYAGPCGWHAHFCHYLTCRICFGSAMPYALEQDHADILLHSEFGSINQMANENGGHCPYVLRLIPGLPGSFFNPEAKAKHDHELRKRDKRDRKHPINLVEGDLISFPKGYGDQDLVDMLSSANFDSCTIC